MAGSYKHVTTARGKLRSPEKILISSMGDAYETIEEMYGMIWYLAKEVAYESGQDIKDVVEDARTHYNMGIAEASPGVQK